MELLPVRIPNPKGNPLLVEQSEILKILNQEKMIRTHMHQVKGIALLTYSPPYTYESAMIYGGHSTTRVGKQMLDLSQHMASVLNNTLCIIDVIECSNKLSSKCTLAFTKQETKAFLQAIELTTNSNKGANIHNNLQRETCCNQTCNPGY
jgi:hypothetical protein